MLFVFHINTAGCDLPHSLLVKLSSHILPREKLDVFFLLFSDSTSHTLVYNESKFSLALMLFVL